MLYLLICFSVTTFQKKFIGRINIFVDIIDFGCFFSDAYLGTGSIANPRYGGSGHVVCIEILSLKGTEYWEEFSAAVGKEWMALGGVPHLAKQYDHLPGIFDDIRHVGLNLLI